MANGKKNGNGNGRKWSNDFYLTGYLMAKATGCLHQVAGALGVTTNTLSKWLKDDPSFAKAIQMGKEASRASTAGDFLDFVYRNVPTAVQEVLNQINECRDQKDSHLRVRAILEGTSKRTRQHLFLYSLISSDFKKIVACEKVGISYHTLTHWIRHDPGFAEIMETMHVYKKHFCEAPLLDLVKDKNPAVVIHVNKTLNADMGYNEKHVYEHHHTGRIEHVYRAEDLDLPVDVRKAVVEAMRRYDKRDRSNRDRDPVNGRFSAN